MHIFEHKIRKGQGAFDETEITFESLEKVTSLNRNQLAIVTHRVQMERLNFQT